MKGIREREREDVLLFVCSEQFFTCDVVYSGTHSGIQYNTNLPRLSWNIMFSYEKVLCLSQQIVWEICFKARNWSYHKAELKAHFNSEPSPAKCHRISS